LARGGTSGISGYTRELLTHLLRTDPKDEYTFFYNGFFKQPLPDDWRMHPRIHIIDRHVPNRLLDSSFRFFNAPKPERFASTANLIFSPHFNLLPNSRLPRVVTFHDLSFLRFPKFFSPKQQLWHWLQRYQQQAQNAAHIVAVSEFTKSDLVEFLGVPPEKISVVYSGLAPEFTNFTTNKNELDLLKTTYQLHRPYFLYLGALEKRKNIITLIHAFTLLKSTDKNFADYQLVLAGRPGYGSKEIFAAARASTSSADIRFLHNVSDQQRAPLYAAARAFVYPSFFEGFGFPPLEAQACGTPVIAADRTSLPEILGDSALLVDPWRTSDLAEALQTIESNSHVRDTIITAGTKNAQNFRWEKTATQMRTIFKNVAT